MKTPAFILRKKRVPRAPRALRKTGSIRYAVWQTVAGPPSPHQRSRSATTTHGKVEECWFQHYSREECTESK